MFTSPVTLRPIKFLWAVILIAFCFACQSFDKREHADNAKPDSTRFVPIILAAGLNEPLAMEILPDNSVLLIERKGAVRLWDVKTQALRTIAHLDVFSGIEDGLLGVALDPDYENNRWVYLYYAVAGDDWKNRLSRFELKDGALVQSSEFVLLEIPTQRKYCCHSGGAMTFGPDGLLYLSTGDNTNAEEAEGYVPIDERPGRELADDQATAANTNDLRGKILRIKPEPDGSYSIPEGNLFSKDERLGRPEIFVMGCRNPYKISVDMKNGYLYWGDVGPFTKVQGREGTLSYDEINQAKTAGFYGWPYFLGDNEAYPDYDFATKQEGPRFDPLNPVNNSPNNTGLQRLPQAQPAMIWYGRMPSQAFHLVGKGGASAMAGPVYYSDLYPESDIKLPAYYDGKLFIYDWVRRWIMAVTFDDQGNYKDMERFLPHWKLAAPMDVKIGPDGAMYLLEYGTNWFSKNADAQLVRIEYAKGNRNPVARITTDKLYGAVPHRVRLSASESDDFDSGQSLSYAWEIGDDEFFGRDIEYTFEEAGVQTVTLIVRDDRGGESRARQDIHVGNTPPEIKVTTQSNKTFFWDGSAFEYKVEVTDHEDGDVDSSATRVSVSYSQYGRDLANSLATASDEEVFMDSPLLKNLDCKTCHTVNTTSIGPSYMQVAKRYDDDPSTVRSLSQKIIQGGNGSWGSAVMPGHPELSAEQASDIIQYILSLKRSRWELPAVGSFRFPSENKSSDHGAYVFSVDTRDRGANSIGPLSARKTYVMRHPLVQVEDFDHGNVRIGTITTAFTSFARARHNTHIRFDSLDLTHIHRLEYRIQANGPGGKVELRLDSLNGEVVSKLDVVAGKVNNAKEGWNTVAADVRKTTGMHNLYFVFENPEAPSGSIFNVDWIYFRRR